ncbi:MAG: hypothetical protein ABSH49_24770 [Bryobacteraceae bacterium]|jgi:hypothetical protein
MNPRNWVRERAERERVCASQAPALWEKVRAALQDASDSYNEEYGNPAYPEVKYELENGKRILIVRTSFIGGPGQSNEERRSVLVTFDEHGGCITFVGDIDGSSGELVITVDGHEVFVTRKDKNERMEPDDVSRLLLQGIFFKPGERKRPRAKPRA